MKIVSEKHVVLSGTVERTREASVRVGAHIMRVLSNLYTNPIDAMVREYLTNMYDAYLALAKSRNISIEQLVASKDFVPPILHLPTALAPELMFKDFGIGMDKDTVWSIFPDYGASTKTNANDEVGGFGLGSKTAYCYTSTWSVESRHNGEMHRLLTAIGTNGIPRWDDMGTVRHRDHSGVTIRIPVKRGDFEAVRDAARRHVPYFPIPIQVENIETPILPVSYLYHKPGSWGISRADMRYNNSKTSVVMGGVRYSLEIGHINDNRSSFYYYNALDLYVPIGSVELVPSRDALQYTDTTKKTVRAAMKKFEKEFADALSGELASCQTEWAALLEYEKMNQIGSLNSIVEELKWRNKTIDLGRGLQRSWTDLLALDAHATITMHGLQSSHTSTISELANMTTPPAYVFAMRPAAVAEAPRTMVVIDDLPTGTLTAVRGLLSERLVSRSSSGRALKFGHKVGFAIIVKSSKLTESDLSNFFGGLSPEYIIRASTISQKTIKVASRLYVKDAIYKWSTLSERWEARVRVPDASAIRYYLPLQKPNGYSRFQFRHGVESNLFGSMKEIAMPMPDTVYGVKEDEVAKFDAAGWKNLYTEWQSAVTTFTKANPELVFRVVFDAHDDTAAIWMTSIRSLPAVLKPYVEAVKVRRESRMDNTDRMIDADETFSKSLTHLLKFHKFETTAAMTKAIYAKYPMLTLATTLAHRMGQIEQKKVLDYMALIG